MTFISYAQNQEDVILWRALRHVERGFYVDVGAADPNVGSVTRAFYERGWSGINIEPLDEHFTKLALARSRDTNLKVLVGREAGQRTFHAFPGTGLSTLNAEIARAHQAAGFSGSEIVVPMLTLTRIIEDWAPQTIHFLKIDVEGAEAEVLEGLDLERIRPWVIVIEANEPLRPASTRGQWEHLVIERGYGLAYFDGLNCFYLADEVAALKERLAVPPNFFDDFMRYPEWSIREEVAKLSQEVAGLRGHADGLEAALQAEQADSANLRNSLQALQAQNVNLQAQNVNLQAQNADLQGQLGRVLGRIHQLETQLAEPSLDRALGRAFRQVQKTGDRLTGGGVRSLATRALTKFVRRSMQDRRLTALGNAILRAFPTLSTALYQLAVGKEAGAVSSTGEPAPDDTAVLAALPASARSVYLRLKATIARSGTWD